MSKKKNKKVNIFEEINIPIYKGSFYLVITDDVEFLKEKLGIDRDKEDLIYGTTYRREDASGEVDTLAIALNPWNKYVKLTHGVIAHEAQHASYFLLKCRGMELTYESEEAFNYLTEWFTNQIYYVMEDNKIRI